MATRTAQADWDGSIQQGNGSMKLGSGAFEGPFSVGSRMEEAPGTNPEELLGAAHAGCFSMALSGVLTQGGHEPRHIHTDARVQLLGRGGSFEIPKIELTTRADVPGISAEEFQQAAETAKETCPVSKALAGVGTITLDAQLTSG